MKFNLILKKEGLVKKDEFNIILEFSNRNKEIEDMIHYINCYKRKVIVNKDYEALEIEYKDIILFYSDKKNNYCKTKKDTYRIKNKLYELEKMDIDFVRISKSCIININHVKFFDLSKTGKIIVKLEDKTEETVSRRKIKEVMNFLEERGI